MHEQLQPNQWYWIRREDGSVAPYRFHRVSTDPAGRVVGEFFVGSFIRRFSLSRVIGEAQMPQREEA